ncbi:MAG: M28 family peptidase [Nitrospirales bacterium]|nr:M28 family peptidase [Nitrospirales bacterium]
MRASPWLLIAGVVFVLFEVGWYGMIRMPGESYRGPIPPLTADEQELEKELRRHVTMLAGEIGERNLSYYDKLQLAVDYIKTRFQKSGYVVRSQEYQVEGRICENIEVEVRGTRHPEEILLIGAHYDSVKGSPGANDNATGVAAVLELARIFSQVPSSRTLRFVAFVNEEPPFFQTPDMGSWVYAQRSRERGEQINAMFSLETIGYYSERPGSQHYPAPLGLLYPSTGNFIGFVGNIQNGELVRRVVGSFRNHAVVPSEGTAMWGGLPGIGWSDHWAFWEAGFPAIMVTDTALFRDPFYHTAKDTPDHIQYESFTRVVSGLKPVILDLANTP